MLSSAIVEVQPFTPSPLSLLAVCPTPPWKLALAGSIQSQRQSYKNFRWADWSCFVFCTFPMFLVFSSRFFSFAIDGFGDGEETLYLSGGTHWIPSFSQAPKSPFSSPELSDRVFNEAANY